MRIVLCVQADNSLVSQLSHTIKRVTERVCSSIERVEFDYFSSANFVGLFVKESFSQILKKITTDFADEMKKSGYCKFCWKCFFLNIEYQIVTHKKTILEERQRERRKKIGKPWRYRGRNSTTAEEVCIELKSFIAGTTKISSTKFIIIIKVQVMVEKWRRGEGSAKNGRITRISDIEWYSWSLFIFIRF